MKGNIDTAFYVKLTEARRILGIGEEAALDEIKKTFHDLIRKWHPDKAGNNAGVYHDKSREIIEANKVIMDYCKDYRISFSREMVNRYQPHEEFWQEHFGNDPMWGPPGK
jgi:DnaJ-class molecular chaperone